MFHKKWIFYCFFSISLLGMFDLSAYELGVSLTGRVAYYRPSSSKIRKIYGNGWADYQLELSKNISPCTQVWAGVSGFSKSGHSRDCRDRTSFQLIPISLGVKQFISLPCPFTLDAYIGAAVCYSFLRLRDHSPYVNRHTRSENFGGLVQFGITRDLFCNAVLSLFVDYYFQKFSFSRHSRGGHGLIYRSDVDASGLKVGLGLGIRF